MCLLPEFCFIEENEIDMLCSHRSLFKSIEEAWEHSNEVFCFHADQTH